MTRNGATSRRILRYGSADIAYSLTLSPRRDLAIAVHPNLDVTVVAPLRATLQQIEAKVRSRAPWVLRQQLRFQDLHPLPTPKRYLSGETHRYRGRQYRLRIRSGSTPSVRLERPFLVVTVINTRDRKGVGELVEAWFRQRAEVLLQRQFNQFVDRHPNLRDLVRQVRIRTMHRRWGSCTQQRTIILNPMLVQHAPGCADYVIAHELCHLRFMNHGRGFEHALTRIMPDWRARRRELNQSGT